MMWITLFLKECKEIGRSITYYIFLACLSVFFVSQMGSVDAVSEPLPGAESYGWKYSEEEDVIMYSALDNLLFELGRNSFVTYPIGFYKQVILSENEQEEIYELLEDVVEQSKDDLTEAVKKYAGSMDHSAVESINIRPDMTYEEFCDVFNRIDKILGGGSKYSDERIYSHAIVSKTYEEAMDDYRSIIENDHVSGAYARLFADYMGIILAILPVFLAVTRVLKDRRAKAEQVIYSKGRSSAVIILTRYTAIIAMTLLPVIILSINPLLQTIYVAANNGITADYFAFIKIIFGWVLPTILFSVSMGFLLTELTNGLLAILLQAIFWIVSVFAANTIIVGYVGWNLVPRFNTVGSYEVFISIFNDLVKNRIFYTIISILMLFGSIILYDMKRRGRMHLDRALSKDIKSKS
ncbi:MAG: ABC transporter permease [Clostridiales bacterium]|nr:ABC transporter permease [Clostridiales bacterium]